MRYKQMNFSRRGKIADGSLQKLCLQKSQNWYSAIAEQAVFSSIRRRQASQVHVLQTAVFLLTEIWSLI